MVMSSRAAAQQSSCLKDSDCDRGFVCKVVGGSACADIACPAGQACPEPEPCTPREFRGCVPGPCATNADCADGMVCFQYSERDCPTSPACPVGEQCPPPTPSDCTAKSVSTCVPPYVPPCKVASDCGIGFECIEDQRCQCTGGTPRPADAGAPPKPPESACTCGPAGTFHCEMKVVDCGSNGDCPKDWSCVEVGASGGGCAPASGGGARDASLTNVCDAGPIVSIHQCMPPFYSVVLPGGTGKDYAEGNVARSDGGLGAGTVFPAVASTPSSENGGCGCRVDGNRTRGTSFIALSLGALTLMLRRRAGRSWGR